MTDSLSGASSLRPAAWAALFSAASNAGRSAHVSPAPTSTIPRSITGTASLSGSFTFCHAFSACSPSS